ncbi:MAG TPA: LPS export ABC transporter periplasmic protein LptC, partial [Candidatus Acidoferrum sp.]|nr:LPS export ABC transporter periplasmic protein LptC [Candidatus Acidoferrum sp.]
MISRLISSLPFILFVLFVVGVPLWLGQPSRAPMETRNAGLGRVPDYLMENMSAVQMGNDGVARQMLFAKRVVHYPDDDSADLEEPHFIETQP